MFGSPSSLRRRYRGGLLGLVVLALLAALLPGGVAAAEGSGSGGGTASEPTLSVAPSAALENAGTIDFVVTLSEPSDEDVRFRLRTSNRSARSKRDFIDQNRVWQTIPAGQTELIVSLELIDDDKTEADERFRVRVANVRGAEKQRRGTVDAVIYDDDIDPGRERFALDILHINDHHSNLDQLSIDLDIAGDEVEFESGGFPRLAAAYDAIEADLGPRANVVRVHAGDAITGTLFYTLFAGEADAALMNEVCFDIFALGNHEFDDSDAGLKLFLDFLDSGVCDTSVLAANVIPEVGTPLAPETTTDSFQPFTVKRYRGEKVGFIGIDIAQKTKVSSSPLESTQFLDEAETAQFYIDLLTAARVDNIVLVTHYGYENDLALAAVLTGADVIVGGDSHSLLGDFGDYGLSAAGEYPTMVTDAAGNRVCVAQAWEYSRVLGQLHVGFDRNGRVTTCEGTPRLLLGDVTDNDPDFDADDPDAVPSPVSDEAIAAAIAADPQLYQIGQDADAAALLAGFSEQVDVLNQEVIGTATEDICLARFPDDGRSALCPVGTLGQGGEIQQLVTDAFLARAFRADIALQNSGGVRIDIPAGPVTIGDAYRLLPFGNTLFELDMTGAEVVLALEQGLGNVLDAGGSSGAFPYGSGIRWDLDATQPFGSRFSNVEVRVKGTTDWLPIDANATYVVVANSFMASGGDGYQVLADVVADGRGVDTFLGYAESFIDYIEDDAAGSIGKPTEFSLQNYTPPAG